jgi:hypothetical protein
VYVGAWVCACEPYVDVSEVRFYFWLWFGVCGLASCAPNRETLQPRNSFASNPETLNAEQEIIKERSDAYEVLEEGDEGASEQQDVWQEQRDAREHELHTSNDVRMRRAQYHVLESQLPEGHQQRGQSHLYGQHQNSLSPRIHGLGDVSQVRSILRQQGLVSA